MFYDDFLDECELENNQEQYFKEYTEKLEKRYAERKEEFRSKLREFSVIHEAQINSDPLLRQNFLEMCQGLGVDPLSSSKSLLGQINLSKFYQNLAIQTIQYCKLNENENGGIFLLTDLVSKLNSYRNRNRKMKDIVSENDVRSAINNLDIHFGSGYQIVKINGKDYLRALPKSLSEDHHTILKKIEGKQKGWSVQELASETEWSPFRVECIIQELLRDGYVWIYRGNDDSIQYWFPSMI